MHKKLCHSNHTDGCSFYYGINGLEDDWNEYEHRKYLEKANKILEIEKDEKKLNIIMDILI